jgi:FlaG/FlaF family flagellin (archaellin)
MLAWWFDPKKLIHHCTQQFMKRENMNYQKRMTRENREEGVSPVVGVMLMLVVTIIIAAVVSGFSGTLISGTQKAPSLTMDVKVVNSGSSTASGFFATVTGVSNALQTKNEEIITSWQTTNKSSSAPAGSQILGGSTSVGNVTYSVATPPFGYGPGTNVTINGESYGNYTLTAGTGLVAQPISAYGSTTSYSYTLGGNVNDSMVYVLGPNWNYLMPGDTVSVKVIDLPTGKVVFQQNVPVTVG